VPDQMDAYAEGRRRADEEAHYSLTKGGIRELWGLVEGDRLTERERLSLCLALNEVELSRAQGRPSCA
jgi:hypothetical protein